jgi:poly-gamma-glutamate synthesis protein (capsule biosynthesis protein)
MAVAEHEFSIAKKDYWGANPFDLVSMMRMIATHRKNIDYLIILIHGGNEYYPLPSPRLMNGCRFLVEMGADAVIVQHTHCPGCFEEYQGSYIVYGQGNLVFDKLKPFNSSWNKGFLVRLSIKDSGKHSMSVIPYEQSVDQIGTRKMTHKAEESFLIDINERSSKLSDTGYIEEQWLTWCRDKKDHYYFRFFPGLLNNRVTQKINSYFPFVEKLYTRKHLLRLENIIRCESHREVIETLLEIRREGDQNLTV